MVQQCKSHADLTASVGNISGTLGRIESSLDRLEERIYTIQGQVSVLMDIDKKREKRKMFHVGLAAAVGGISSAVVAVIALLIVLL